MNSKEKIEFWKEKIFDLEKEIEELESGKIILSNILDEVKTKRTLKLEILLEWVDLEEEISYLDDWIGYYKNKVKYYNDRIRISEKLLERDEVKSIDKKPEQKEQQDLEKIREGVRLLFEEKPKRQRIQFRFYNPLKNYAAVFIILALVISVFLLKPAITGQVILSKETIHTDNLNLVINESGAYDWQVKNPGDIKSVKATGSVIGNGTVKIYIEKDGKRHLIYDNKK